jgi:CubicO group peptidase (beta-lactamase class C family)
MRTHPGTVCTCPMRPGPHVRRLLDAVLCLALAIVTGAQPTTAPLPVSTVSQIDSAVAAFMTRAKAPGLSLAVGEDGELRFEKGYGLADLENLVPATASTVYHLASVSKPLTAVAAMQLIERPAGVGRHGR